MRVWLIPVLCVAAVGALAPRAALAWNAEGHRIIARLAWERLTTVARAQVDVLVRESPKQGTPGCPVASLEDAATWPDCVRPLRGKWDYLAAMHYEDVPLCGSETASVYCPDGKCVVPEIKRAIAILQNLEQPPVARLQALEEVAHFVGDMHQPLHVADNHDRGGNDVHVIVEGHPSNLHHVWDTEALEYAVGTDEPLAASRLEPLVKANASAWAHGDLDSWAAETHLIATSYVYPKLAEPPACGTPAPEQAISQAYLDGAAPIVRQQLARAAVRLAQVLNSALD